MSVSRDQQVGIAGRLRDVQHLLRPRQGLRYAPLRQDVARQSPEDGQQRVVALERLRQGKGRMQAGPDFRGGPAFERHPRGAKAACAAPVRWRLVAMTEAGWRPVRAPG